MRPVNVVLVSVFLIVACATLVSEVDSQRRFEWPEKSKNLQVLPKDLPGERLAPVMRGFSRSLGVRCSYCHVGKEGEPLSAFDFASDENPKKNIARKMYNMLAVVNDSLKTIEPSGTRVNMWCNTCHRGRPRPITLAEELWEVYEKAGSDSVSAYYGELRERFYGRGAYDFGEGSLNQLGYQVLEKEDYTGAIQVFLLNATQFPASGNVYDSLGEAYAMSGETDLAIQSYEKALELDPKNKNAVEKLKELRGDE